MSERLVKHLQHELRKIQFYKKCTEEKKVLETELFAVICRFQRKDRLQITPMNWIPITKRLIRYFVLN